MHRNCSHPETMEFKTYERGPGKLSSPTRTCLPSSDHFHPNHHHHHHHPPPPRHRRCHDIAVLLHPAHHLLHSAAEPDYHACQTGYKGHGLCAPGNLCHDFVRFQVIQLHHLATLPPSPRGSAIHATSRNPYRDSLHRSRQGATCHLWHRPASLIVRQPEMWYAQPSRDVS